ncbi:MAG: hypothetical protein ABSD56_08480 [Bryobacteraceae bacterium]
MLDEAVYYSRMALGIYKFMRTRPLPDPEAVIRHQLENREANFLSTARQVIFSNPRNPYHEMFRLAGCTCEDLERAVHRDGLESALAALHRQGVYLTHDEFKGKAAIVRSGRHIPAQTRDFRNPLVVGRMDSLSSGSRSKGTRTPKSLELQLYREAHHLVCDREYGLEGRAHIEVKPILPSTSGLRAGLRAHRRGYEVDRWFAVGGGLRDSGHYRWLTQGLLRFGNLLGAGAPPPTYLPSNDFKPVAEWIARRRSEGVACVVEAFTSPAVRVAAAAVGAGLDIRGTVFMVAGEALTDAKRAVIGKAGAEVYTGYPITEVGSVGRACRQMKTGNCVHVFRDALAVISHRRRAPLTDVEVNALLFTNLLPFAAHILINVEMDDSGVIEPAHCDCLFSRLGFTEQVRDISSFGKLTGQGMTLVGTDIVRILEEVLPARLGGGPGDYQLVEHEGATQTQLTLRVSPRVGIASSEKAKECFLKEIRRFYGGTLAARMWSHAEGVEVVIAEPLATLTGKVLPLHLLGSGVERPNAA